ncbi:hypothetical protein B9Z19DRAFT_1083671 [Tuber borchii]|uniref:Uncharacterized protein n=1 Tax=Tuber borchii TaxID=42251 RepID=A0A2T6ZSX1_TUBBO|nr:hypothetical protein B9Z19DRAFT_1083671 [Tuber borchii]
MGQAPSTMSSSEFITIYANLLLALAAWGITSAVMIWQINKHANELKKELKALTKELKKEFKTNFEEPLSSFMTAIRNPQGISPPPAYTTMKCLPGESEIIAKLAEDIAERFLAKMEEDITKSVVPEANIEAVKAIPEARDGDVSQGQATNSVELVD